MIDLARSSGLSPEEIKEQEFKLKELEERRAASRPLGKRSAEAHKRKEQPAQASGVGEAASRGPGDEDHQV